MYKLELNDEEFSFIHGFLFNTLNLYSKIKKGKKYQDEIDFLKKFLEKLEMEKKRNESEK